ncbi:MAG: diguanylate cyclase [Desulfobacteraceae bacterium]|nr:diguanylate cyclase [Desulfobacteraceae bacterium]MBC2757985.1 diguanylate cyclase [Desulfobacteraceae bacterium]
MTAKILIVDDDHAIRDSIQEFLTILDFKTYTAESAEKALSFLRTYHVDVVITDIIMNGMDGLEMTKVIKENYDTDIIVITGYTGDYSYEEAISKGADDFIFKPVKFEELLLRLKRVLRERVLTQERIQMLERLKELAITDDLTKLYNSRHFYNQLENEINRYNRYQRPLSLLMIDVDHFKEFNDTQGHLEGDKVLHKIAKLISSCLRTMDTAYRYGGEEFTVILPETTCDSAMAVSERINEVVKNDLFIRDDKKDMSVSIGVTEYLPGELVTDFVRRADKAMYMAKEGGRNRTSLLLS